MCTMLMVKWSRARVDLCAPWCVLTLKAKDTHPAQHRVGDPVSRDGAEE